MACAMPVAMLAASFSWRCRCPRSRDKYRRARSTTKTSPSRHFCRPSKPRSRRWIARGGSICSRRPPTRIRRSSSSRRWFPRASRASSSRSAIASALQGTLPGEGYRLVVEVFMETGPRGRIATWHLDIRRPRGEDIGRQPWRILAAGSARVDRRAASALAASREAVRARRISSSSRSISSCACRRAMCSSRKRRKA